MTDWGLMATIKKTRIPNTGTLVFSLLFDVLESISECTYLLFRQSACIEAAMHTAMVYSKVSE